MLQDFGMDNFRTEGAAIEDILRAPLVRTTVLVMLPDQTLPEHRHPKWEGHPGKEETVRVITGSVKTYQPGEPAAIVDRLPEGKEAYYTARFETALGPGEQVTLPPDEPHWFQAGPEGVEALEFMNRVDEMKYSFTDPSSTGVYLTDKD